MSQTYSMPPALTDNPATVLTSTIPDAMAALRTGFSGASAPTSPIAYQTWYDTTTGLFKVRDSGNANWITFAPLLGNAGRLTLTVPIASVSATTTFLLGAMPAKATIVRIGIISDTTTSSSSGNEWQFALKNRTATTDLFSGTVGTYTHLAGVGPGSANGTGTDITLETGYWLTVNQNADVNASAVLRFDLTKVGTVTTIVNARLQLDFYERG